jgi:phage gp36-like protein
LSYITQQDLEEELGSDKLLQLTDPNKTGEVDSAIVGKAISYAVGLFESYARTRYTLPVPTTEMVRSICLDLAVYKLRRSRATTQEAMDALKKSLYDPAISLLKAIQKGEAALDIPAQEETAELPASPDRILSGTGKSQFGDDKIGGY